MPFWKIFVVCLLVFNLFFVLFYNRLWSSGDEVHYLVVTSSLIHDGDLNLTNNYENKDYFTHHGVLEPPHVTVDVAGQSRPFHSILLSVLVIPGFWALSLVGARINIFLLHLLGMYLLYHIGRKLEFDKKTIFITFSLYLTSLPILIFSNVIFPDLLQGYLYTAIGLLIHNYFTSNYKAKFLFLASTLLGLAIFLHIKLLLLSALFIIGFFLTKIYNDYKHTNKFSFQKSSLWILPAFISAILTQALLNYRWFNTFRLDYAINPSGKLSLFAINPLQGLGGQLIDIESGVLWWGPGLILWLLGLYLWSKRDFLYFSIIAFPCLAFTLLSSTFYDWRAGFSPAGRYIIYLFPVFIPAAFVLVDKFLKTLYGKITLIFLLGLNLIMLFPIIYSNRFGYPSLNAINNHLQFYYHSSENFIQIERIFKQFDFSNFNLNRLILSSFFLVFILVANYCFSYAKKPNDK